MYGRQLQSEVIQEVWATYAQWCCIHIMKMITLIWFTGRFRVSRQVIHSEEDRMWMKNTNVILCSTGGGHPDVDRIRSTHRSELEIVLPYLAIIPIWLSTSPTIIFAKFIINAFGILNVIYTLVQMKILHLRSCFNTFIYSFNLIIPLYIATISAIYYAL